MHGWINSILFLRPVKGLSAEATWLWLALGVFVLTLSGCERRCQARPSKIQSVGLRCSEEINKKGEEVGGGGWWIVIRWKTETTTDLMT